MIRKLLFETFSSRQSRLIPLSFHQQQRLCASSNSCDNVSSCGTISELRERLVPCMSTLFSTLSNIERKLPEALQREVAEHGGLQVVLRDDPRFVMSVIGKSTVARVSTEAPKPGGGTTRSSDPPTPRSEHRSRASIGNRGAILQSLDAAPHDLDVMPTWCVDNSFPRFCVPLDALCAARRVVKPGVYDSPSAVEDEIRRVQLPALHLDIELLHMDGYVRPRRNRSALYDCVVSATSPTVSSKPLNVDVAASTTVDEPERDDLASDGNHDDFMMDDVASHNNSHSNEYGHNPPALAPPAALLTQLPPPAPAPQQPVLSALERWLFDNGHFVEPYETYRVARLMACTEWTPIASVKEECDVLLPQNRQLQHVLLTSPHLFELSRPHHHFGGTYPNGRSSSSSSSPAAVAAALPPDNNHHNSQQFVRYRVPPMYLTHRNYSKEQIAIMERKVHAIRQMKFPQRDKMRRLLREIVEGSGKCPFLDPNVFAFALLDCLPVESAEGVSFTAVLNSRFTKTQRDCRPILLEPFFDSFKELFVVSQGRHSNGLVVSRRASEKQSSSEGGHPAASHDIASDEEVVMSLFERFPTRRDPTAFVPHNSIRGLLSLRAQRAIRLRGWASIAESQREKIEVMVLVSDDDEKGRSLKKTRSNNVATAGDGVEAVRFRGKYLESLVETYQRLGGGEVRDEEAQRQ